MSRKRGLVGVYKIQSKARPNKIYIGSSSINIKLRWRDHLKQLEHGVHHSQKLQNHYNKYGRNDFVFSIVAICESEELTPINGIIRPEQFFIWAYDPWFNTVPIAGSNKGINPSKDTCLKMSINHADVNGDKNPMYNKRHSLNTRQLIGDKRRGNKRTELEIQKQTNSLIANYRKRPAKKGCGVNVNGRFTNENNCNSRAVLDLQTGIYYTTATEAYIYNNVGSSLSHFHGMLRGSYKNFTNFIYIE